MMYAATLARLIATVSATGLIASIAYAEPAQPADKDPGAVKAGTYVLEPVHTRVLFAVSHLGFTTWYGDFTHASGMLSLDKDAAKDGLDVDLPIRLLSTTNEKLDGELRGAEWFDADRFPDARFVSRNVTQTGAGRADVVGDLTLHGVTKPMTLHVRFNGAGINPLDKAYTVGFDAHGVIKRSDFGVSKYVPLVGDEVELIISAAFEHKN